MATLNKESKENEVADVHLIVPWAQQWEMKSQFNGEQNKTILCQKKSYLACFTTFLNLLSCHIRSHLFWILRVLSSVRQKLSAFWKLENKMKMLQNIQDPNEKVKRLFERVTSIMSQLVMRIMCHFHEKKHQCQSWILQFNARGAASYTSFENPNIILR